MKEERLFKRVKEILLIKKAFGKMFVLLIIKMGGPPPFSDK